MVWWPLIATFLLQVIGSFWMSFLQKRLPTWYVSRWQYHGEVSKTYWEEGEEKGGGKEEGEGGGKERQEN